MKRYYVKVQVNYDGEIVANSPEEAEEKAWHSYYGDDAVLTYDSVESIDVDEYDVCDVCDKDVEEYCECEDEEEQDEE
jgi:uncharacterized protein YbbC (DUF1343 family)